MGQILNGAVSATKRNKPIAFLLVNIDIISILYSVWLPAGSVARRLTSNLELLIAERTDSTVLPLIGYGRVVGPNRDVVGRPVVRRNHLHISAIVRIRTEQLFCNLFAI
jgi:hypothetical protein